MENRQHARFNSKNLLSYACVNAHDVVVQQGMGKTLDISEGGILLETHVPIISDHTVQFDIGFKDDVAQISGEVAYTRIGDSGRTESGIRFCSHSQESHAILVKFIQSFKDAS